MRLIRLSGRDVFPAGKQFTARDALRLPPSAAFSGGESLWTLGLTSLGAVGLISAMEAALGVPLPATLAFEHTSVDALVAYLAPRVPPAPPALAAAPSPAVAAFAGGGGVGGGLGRGGGARVPAPAPPLPPPPPPPPPPLPRPRRRPSPRPASRPSRPRRAPRRRRCPRCSSSRRSRSRRCRSFRSRCLRRASRSRT